MPHFENDGRALYYEVHGEGEPLLCVMGLSADHLAWTLQVPAFSERYRTIVFDNRDVGQSFRAEGPYDVADMAQDTLALADGLGLERFHLLGMSLGGTIAQELALAAPERVLSLTLIVTYAWAGRWGREFARLWGRAAAQRSDEEHIDWLILQTVSQEFYETEAAVEFLRNMLLANPYPQPRDAFLRQLDAAEEAEPLVRGGLLVAPRDRLDLRMVRCDAGADEAERRRQRVVEVDLEAGLEQVLAGIEPGRAGADDRCASSLHAHRFVHGSGGDGALRRARSCRAKARKIRNRSERARAPRRCRSHRRGRRAPRR